MKRILALLTLICVLFSVVITIPSCRKEVEDADNPDNFASGILLDNAKTWYAEHTSNKTKGNTLSNLRSKKLTLKWDSARVEKDIDGDEVLLVPTEEGSLHNLKLGAIRTVVFNKVKEKVTGAQGNRF